MREYEIAAIEVASRQQLRAPNEQARKLRLQRVARRDQAISLVPLHAHGVGVLYVQLHSAVQFDRRIVPQIRHALVFGLQNLAVQDVYVYGLGVDMRIAVLPRRQRGDARVRARFLRVGVAHCEFGMVLAGEVGGDEDEVGGGGGGIGLGRGWDLRFRYTECWKSGAKNV